MDEDAGGGLPTLQRWLHGIDDHVLRRCFVDRNAHRWWGDPVLVALDETLAILEAAKPSGLGSKRRAFRTHRGTHQPAIEPLLPLRAELVVASLLAEAAVPFRFNTGSGPDLLVGTGTPEFGIEISSRAPRSVRHLSRKPSDALRELARFVAAGVLRDERKVRQAQALPTVMVVDLSGSDLPDVRHWDTAFAPLWQPGDTYLALGAMRCMTTVRTPEIRFSVNPYADQSAVALVAGRLHDVPVLADLAGRRSR
ncbi:hypothetical protein ACFFX1_49570 [Dactylosporangium sucinum]|uniref:Uncharacterized protein n=1 Tax=Dactylosporangium sucinum TaxID=1424081 RepID=A0A917WZ58_9ACTN|nr:hypothetical protein [Dactylosporangium sucinum]GGM42565.1 hypothetical protein GCM10007977_050110 [Dactylosporangium sucinum]